MLVKRVGMVLVAATLTGLLAACAPAEEPVDRVTLPTPTVASVAPTDEPEGSVDDARVIITGMGVSFALPAEWDQTSPGAMMWTRAGLDDAVLGFTRAEVAPPAEVEAVLLPADSVIQGAETLDVPWADSARRYLVEVYRPDGQAGEIDHYEMHVIAVVSGADGRLAFDFYLIAPDRAVLEDLQPVLDGMVGSSAFGG